MWPLIGFWHSNSLRAQLRTPTTYLEILFHLNPSATWFVTNRQKKRRHPMSELLHFNQPCSSLQCTNFRKHTSALLPPFKFAAPRSFSHQSMKAAKQINRALLHTRVALRRCPLRPRQLYWLGVPYKEAQKCIEMSPDWLLSQW
jgi:hypothetical protein